MIMHMMRMLIYSAIKRSAKRLAPNSILNPDTSSDSPSAKSKGVRLVSAKTVINQIRASGAQRRRGGAGEARSRWLKSKESRVVKREIKMRVMETS